MLCVKCKVWVFQSSNSDMSIIMRGDVGCKVSSDRVNNTTAWQGYSRGVFLDCDWSVITNLELLLVDNYIHIHLIFASSAWPLHPQVSLQMSNTNLWVFGFSRNFLNLKSFYVEESKLFLSHLFLRTFKFLIKALNLHLEKLD